MIRPSAQRISLPGGREAIAAEATPETSGVDLVAALELPPARGVVALNGGTEELDDAMKTRLGRVLVEGLVGVARSERLILVTGGTDAGIFALLGAGLAEDRAPACVGVAVSDLVAWRDAEDGAAGEEDRRVALEPHHTHFVLARGRDWGDETPALLALLGALGQDLPSAAVIVGGGEVTRREALAHARAGRPLLVLEGSGRFADELAAWAGPDREKAPGDLREILGSDMVEIVPLEQGPEALAEAVRRRLRLARDPKRERRDRLRRARPALSRRLPRLRAPAKLEPIVPRQAQQANPALAEDFALLDRELVPTYTQVELEAQRAQNQFWLEQLLLIVGAGAATVLGALQTALTGEAWPGIAEAVVAGLISAVALRARELAARERYMESRLKAERLKSEYFQYLGRAGDYAADADPGRVLRRRVVEIETDTAT